MRKPEVPAPTSTGDDAGGAFPPPGPAPGETLWLDGPEVSRRIRRAPRAVRHHLTELAETGITLVRGAVPVDVCEAVVADLDLHLRAHGEQVAALVAQHGSYRVNNLQATSTAAVDLCLQPKVLAIVDAALGYPAVPYSSLAFVKGTEQDIHRDGPYFATWPEGFFFGAWTALEDIHPESGPLRYHPGGHRVEAERHHEQHEYGPSVEEACRAAGIVPTTISELAQGDTVIWHPELPHGGSPVIDDQRTRKSIVVHYKAGAVPVRTYQAFFDRSTEAIDLRYVRRGGRWMVDQGGTTLDH